MCKLARRAQHDAKDHVVRLAEHAHQKRIEQLQKRRLVAVGHVGDGVHLREQTVQLLHLRRVRAAPYPAEPAERDHFAQLQKRVHQLRMRRAAVRHDDRQRLQIRPLPIGCDIGGVARHDLQKAEPLQLFQGKVYVRLAQVVLRGQFALRGQPVARIALPAEDLLEHAVDEPLLLCPAVPFICFHNALFPLETIGNATDCIAFSDKCKAVLTVF